MNTLFPTESPNQHLNRIKLIEDQDVGLETLPELSIISVDYTHIPPDDDDDDDNHEEEEKRITPIHQNILSVNKNILNHHHNNTTSTPAPPSLAFSKSNSVLSSSHSYTIFNQPSSSSTATSLSSKQQRQYPISTAPRSHNLLDEVSADQISIEKVDYASGSGSGGEDSPNVRKRRANEDVQNESADQTSSSQDSLEAYFKQEDHNSKGQGREGGNKSSSDLTSTSFSPIPMIQPTGGRHDYTVPLSGSSRTPSPSNLVSARAKRISAAGLSIRRKPSSSAIRSTSAIVESREESSMLSTPGTGRHLSPLSTPSQSIALHQTTHDQFPSIDSTSLSRIYTDDDKETTPKAGEMKSLTAAQKRKIDLLAVVRSSSKPRAFRGTPHPRNKSSSLRRETLSEESGEGTSSDLTGEIKANSYLQSLNQHLTMENQGLTEALNEMNHEVLRLKKESKGLENQMDELSGRTDQSAKLDEGDEETKDLQLYELQERLESMTNDRDNQLIVVGNLREQFVLAAARDSSTVQALQARENELLIELEDKEGDLDAASGELEEQEKEFADKMQKLEEELCRVMEEQEDQLEGARADLEDNRVEEGKRREEDGRKLSEARRVIDELEERLEDLVAEKDQLEQRLREREDDTRDGHVVEERAQVSTAEIQALQRNVESKEVEIGRLSAEIKKLQSQHGIAIGSAWASLRQVESALELATGEYQVQAIALQQAEEACDELERLNSTNAEELESLRSQLSKERTEVMGLASQLNQLKPHKTKSKSPLGNELFSTSTRDPLVINLETELEEARLVIVRLNAALKTKEEVQKGLKSTTIELESRVRILQGLQNGGSPSPRRTPDKSVMFQEIIGMQTPKGPDSMMMNNLSSWNANVSVDTTITPTLQQILHLEMVVSSLERQLSQANTSIDHKIDTLESAGIDMLQLSKALENARRRIGELEKEVERMGGSATTKINASLRSALDGVARNGSSPRDCNQAHKAIERLRNEFDEGKLRLQQLGAQKVEVERKKIALEEKLETVDSELSHVKQEIARGGSSALLERFKTKRSVLVQERNDLIHQLANLNETSSSIAASLSSTTLSHSSLRTQLDTSIQQIQSLKASLSQHDTILAHVPLLQEDLERLRDEVEGLGRELEGVKNRERGGNGMAMEQLVRLREKLGVLREERRLHDCTKSKRVEGTFVNLLGRIEDLRRRVTREMSFNEDLKFQKHYLSQVVLGSQSITLPTTSSRSRSYYVARPRPSLKVVVRAIMAMNRFRVFANEARAGSSSEKTRQLRAEEYPAVRGHVFVA